MLEEYLLKEFAISKGLVTFLLLYYMEEGEKCDTVLSEIRFLIPLQVFFKLFRLSLKNFVKYERLLLFSNVDIKILYSPYHLSL